MIRILIVDDDQPICDVLGDVIESHFRHHPEEGATEIVTAGNGVEAKGIVKKDDRAFDIVITDKDMPEMNGPELLLWLRINSPHSHLILMSGEKEPQGHSADSFLQKPFTPETVGEILDCMPVMA